MEDRCTAKLYLELGDASAPACVDRAREVLEEPGAGRVTWWENCIPGRTDLPMRVHDGTTLVVVEADESFRAPSPPFGVSEAHCFRRHPRPSQGILTNGPTLGLLVVWISPRTADVSTRLRDWGDFAHIRHIAAAGIPGFTQISVYENVADREPRYMHFYEFDNLDAEGTYSKMIDFVGPRLGGTAGDAYNEWADWRAPGGRLFYCNTFRRLGEVAKASSS
jgi:hypothetical protein